MNAKQNMIVLYVRKKENAYNNNLS